jgi:N utilization substance protein A
LEVPELVDGDVEIRAIAREPGHRTKIAVLSHDPNVDPVGACVGARGSRVRQVVNELRGEKVDIVEWREDTRAFISEALSPARVKEVRLDEDEKVATVIVPDHQLSLAIGKEGQNARLAARLTGYKIDIRSESQDLGLEIDEETGLPVPADAAPAAAVADTAESVPDPEESVPDPEEATPGDAAEEVTEAEAEEPPTAEAAVAEADEPDEAIDVVAEVTEDEDAAAAAEAEVADEDAAAEAAEEEDEDDEADTPAGEDDPAV